MPWLFVVSNRERFLREIAELRARSETVEMILPGTEHTTSLLTAHPDLPERIAVCLERRLR